MPFPGEILSLACALIWATAVMFLRVSARQLGAFELNLFKNLVALGLFLASLPFVPGAVQALGRSELLVLALSGILGITLADTLFLSALNRLGAARSAIVDCLFSPFVILLSVLLLGERLALGQLLGFGLILAGILTAVYERGQAPLDARQLRRGALEGALSMFLMAAGIVLAKPVVEHASPFGVATVRLAAALLATALWMAGAGRLRQTWRRFQGPLPWPSMVLGGVLGTYLSLVVWIAGYKYTQASIASILNQTSVFFIILLAGLFLRERATARQVLGSVLGFLGVALLFLQAR